jgi:hypothetical protein
VSLLTKVINKVFPSFSASAPVLGTTGVVGELDYGPESPTSSPIKSINELAEIFGPRTATSSTVYDWADAFFALGGRRLYLSRPLNNEAAAAKLELETTGKKKTLVVTAKYKGINGNNIKLELVENEGKTAVKLVVKNAEGEVLEVSGEYAKAEELLAWGKSHEAYVLITEGSEYSTGKGEKLEKLAVTKLAGGKNPKALTNTELVAGLALFTQNLGPMRVAIPGHYEEAIRKGLAEHAATHEARRAVVDLEDNATPATLLAGKTGIPTAQQGYVDFTSSTAIIPGVTPGTTRKVAGSALFCALGAQVAATGNLNQAAAGSEWAVSPYVLGFTHTFTREQEETLVEGGINVWGEELGNLCLIGFVSAVSRETDEIFWSAAAGAERMALTYEGGLIMSKYNFKTIDGQGNLITKCKGELQGLGKRHFEAGALFGEKASEACTVEMGEPINTPASEQRGELNAQMQVRISEYAQSTTLTIISRPITANLNQ